MKTRERWSRSLTAAALGFAICCACDQKAEPSFGSETHFLVSCDASCPEGSSCICGVCTRPCSASVECVSLDSSASCSALAPRVAEGRCEITARNSACELNCLTDADCASLSGGFGCQAGVCRLGTQVNGNRKPIVDCAPTKLLPSEVLILGDALIELSTFTSRLEQLAIDAGVLAANEHFRDSASAMASVLSQTGALSFFEQYAAARQRGLARIIVLDGGETDMLNADCGSELSYACPIIQSTVRGFQNLLRQFAEDEVQHVVYFFYPDPRDNPKLKTHLDALRPLFENACGQSPVACHWIDLRATFSAAPNYLGVDGIVLSEAGGNAAAELVWQRMQQRCLVPKE
jgi:hypothetical protein